MASQQHRSSVVVFGLIVLLLVLAIIAAVAAAILVFSDRLPSAAASPWVSPLSAVKTGAINPALALGSLADIPEQTIVERAIAGGSVDTAFATLLYSTSLNDQTRTAGLLALAGKLAKDSKKDKAVLVAQTAVDVAILSPIMPDYSRSALLSQAGQALSSAGKTDEATQAYNTAAIIAEHSGRIDASYRQILLNGLANDVALMGRKEQAQALRAAGNADPPPPDKTPYVLPSLLVPLVRDDSSVWTDLDTATTNRVSSAQALIAALESNQSTRSEPLRQALEKTLVTEDLLRDKVLSNGMAQTDNLLQRAAFARGRMEWLTLKWRVARQGFGMSLVAAWESQARDIEASLRRACADYYLILLDVAASLPGQLESIQGAIDIIQDQIKMGRLGLPPAAQEAEMVRALDKAERERIGLGGGYLSVTMTTGKNGSSLLTVVSIQ